MTTPSRSAYRNSEFSEEDAISEHISRNEQDEINADTENLRLPRTSFKKRLPRDFFDDALPFKINGHPCKLIPLTQGQFALVWEEDYRRIAANKWCARWCNLTQSYYAIRAITVDGKTRTVLMHREILGLQYRDGKIADHREPSETLNNQRNNLRVVNGHQSSCNRRLWRGSTSGFKGVTRNHRNNKWVARIRVNGKLIYLGEREAAQDAAKLYQMAAITYHGDYARTA
jgi:hypothetical protein